MVAWEAAASCHDGLLVSVVALHTGNGAAIPAGLPPEAISLAGAHAVAAIPIGPALESALAASQTLGFSRGQRSVANALTDACALVFNHGRGGLRAAHGRETGHSQAGDGESFQKAFHRVFLCNYKPQAARKVVAAAAEIFHLSGAMLS